MPYRRAAQRKIPPEKRNIMGTYNNLKPVPKPQHIVDFRQMLSSSAERFNDKALYVYKENGELLTTTYIQFYNNVRAFATGLYEVGLAGKNIAVIGDTHPAWLCAYYSVMLTGGIIVPLDHELDMPQAEGFMQIAKCAALVYTSAMNEKIEKRRENLSFLEYLIPQSSDISGDKVLSFDRILEIGNTALENGDTRFDDAELDMEKTSAILFTSGTTGTSKGVMLSHKNLVTSANASCLSTQYGPDDCCVSVLPIHHTYEMTTGHLAVANLGLTVYVCEGIRYVTRCFKEYKPTMLLVVPLYLETIHKKIWAEIRRKGIEKKVRAGMAISNKLLKLGIDNREKLFGEITAVFGGRLKSVVVGGAPIDPVIVKDFYAFGISVFQGYGITECAPLVAVNRPGNVKFDSVGQVVDFCEVKIAPLPDSDNGEGEILVRGDNVMLGYYENEEATEAAFTEDGWFRTGDIGTIDKKGFITITGRLKNVIIASNGKNVFPEELEERLLRLPAVHECVVVGRDDENGDTVITAVIVPDYEVLGEGTSDTAANMVLKEAIAQVNKTLPAYKHINRFEIRHEDFEKTLTKKIKRFLVK